VGVLVSRRQMPIVLACLCPLALNFVAAALHRYPYGGHVRLAMYFAPACCLLAGLGASAVMAWIAARRNVGYAPMAVTLGLLTLLPIGSAVRDLCRPYRAYDDVQARDFARWFWATHEDQGEVACMKSDLAADFSPGNFRMQFSAIYLCNQWIYSPRRLLREPVHWERISADWPLRCAEYKSPAFYYHREQFRAWLAEMQSRFDLVDWQHYPIPTSQKGGENGFDFVDVYTFVPKAGIARGNPDENAVRR
jgi:hypothetical protein